MPREIYQFTSPLTQQQVFDCFMQFFAAEGFASHVENGEQCLKKGVGLAQAPQFVKITAMNNVYTLEAWIKFAAVPGVYVNEMDLKGFTGKIPKGKLRKRVETFLPKVQAQRLQ